MNYRNFIFILSIVLMMPIEATEINQKQQTVYPQNPDLVKEAGDMNDPKIKEEFCNAMKRASKGTYIASWGCGIASIGCLGALVYTQSGTTKVGTAALSLFLAAASSFLNQVSTVQASMAQDQELVKTEVSSHVEPQSTNPIDIADGIYIFSTRYCHPCKLLHKTLPEIQKSLPDFDFFEYAVDINDTATQMLIKQMNITIRSVPLTVVVKNQTIVCIIAGYSSANDFIQKITSSVF